MSGAKRWHFCLRSEVATIGAAVVQVYSIKVVMGITAQHTAAYVRLIDVVLRSHDSALLLVFGHYVDGDADSLAVVSLCV